MNKEQLETNMAALKLLQSETNDKARDYQNQIAKLEKQIEDINKPELTPQQIDAIERAVEQAVSEFDFTDTENFEIDYSLDYDGRVQCETHEFINGDDLVMNIVTKVCNLFKEIEDESTDTKQ